MKAEGAKASRSWIVGIGTALALLLAVVVGGLALQAPADAYPATVCSVQISPASGHVHSGQTLTVAGTSSTTTHWTVTINGVVHYYTGTTFTVHYKVPPVSHRTTIGVTVYCSNSTGALTRSYRIVVDPFSLPGHGGSGLPNTGGPSQWWLLAGLMLVVMGTSLLWRHRPAPKPVGKHARGS